MDRLREKEIFDAATEQLDVYVPACLKRGEIGEAEEFLKPGGPYVRFALKEFVKKLLGEMIRPAGERQRVSEYPDLEPIYETVKRELPEQFGVRRDLIGYTYSEFVGVTISELLSFRIKREDVRYLLFAVSVRGYDGDDDGDWMGLAAGSWGTSCSSWRRTAMWATAPRGFPRIRRRSSAAPRNTFTRITAAIWKWRKAKRACRENSTACEGSAAVPYRVRYFTAHSHAGEPLRSSPDDLLRCRMLDEMHGTGENKIVDRFRVIRVGEESGEPGEPENERKAQADGKTDRNG